MKSAPYYLKPRAARSSFKPYVHKDVKRDLHTAGMASIKISAALRRARKTAARREA